MARYSIDGQILTDMADNIRAAHIERKVVASGSLSLALANKTVPAKLAPGKQYKLIFTCTRTSYGSAATMNIQESFQPLGKLTYSTVGQISCTPGETTEAYFQVNVPITELNFNVTGTGVYGTYIIEEADNPDNFDGNHAPEAMVEHINTLKNYSILPQIIDRSIAEITAEQLAGVATLGKHLFYNCSFLKSVEVPESLKYIDADCFYGCSFPELTLPSSVNYIYFNALYNATIDTVTFLNTEKCVEPVESTRISGFDKVTNIKVPGQLYNAYRTHSAWKDYVSKFSPYDAWIDDYVSIIPTLVYNTSATATIPLVGFDYVPEVSVTTETADVVAISDINVTTTELTFNVSDLGVEGTYSVNIVITRDDGVEIPAVFTGRVMETIPPSSYTVSNPNNHEYTFELNDAGYYESNCQKQPSEYAFCRVHIINYGGKTVHFDCINYAESNYDYGLLGKVNNDCASYSVSQMETNAYHSFKGKQLSTVQTVTYTNAVDECFIDVMYKKDGSGDSNNDSLQFQVRFE